MYVAEIFTLNEDPQLRKPGYRQYTRLACEYGFKPSCAKTPDIENAERSKAKEQLVKERSNLPYFKTSCGETPQMVRYKIGNPDSAYSCQDNVFEAYLFGRTWIFFKGGAAALLMDHQYYKGAYLNNLGYNYKYKDLCK